MVDVTIDIIAAVGGGVLAIVWFVRLEGRIKGHDQLFAERKMQVDAALQDIKTSLQEIKDTLKQAPRDVEAAQLISAAKSAAQDVVAAAKVIATTIQTAAELVKTSTNRRRNIRSSR